MNAIKRKSKYDTKAEINDLIIISSCYEKQVTATVSKRYKELPQIFMVGNRAFDITQPI